MAEPTANVRLKLETHRRLVQCMNRIVAAEQAHRAIPFSIDPEPINPACIGATFDQMITYLLDQYEAHHERAKLQRSRRRAQAQDAEEAQDAGEAQK